MLPKPHRLPHLIITIIVLSLVAFLVGCAGTMGPEGPQGDQGPPGPAGPAGPPADSGVNPAYVGSEVCADCHADVMASYSETGHPHALTPVDGGRPDLEIDEPAVGWEDVSYVIGGYHWQARFVDSDGDLVTGEGAQYNLPNEALNLGDEFVTWEPGDVPDCGTCHTTGYIRSDHGPLSGDFSEPGVTCESCHGPGGLHVNDPEVVPAAVDTTSAMCLSCHVTSNTIAADESGVFIDHDLAYPNTYVSKHAALECVECHSPHGDEDAPSPAATCASCHWQQAEFAPVDHPYPDCVDCHMADIAVNAVGDAESLRGDFSPHLFAINPFAEEQFVDGESVNYITVPYACVMCHSENGIVGSMDVETLRAFAQGYHDRPSMPVSAETP